VGEGEEVFGGGDWLGLIQSIPPHLIRPSSLIIFSSLPGKEGQIPEVISPQKSGEPVGEVRRLVGPDQGQNGTSTV
jgi:hypothetical protein